jgi:hypothetical protein
LAASGKVKQEKKELTVPGGAMPAGKSRCTAADKKWLVRLYGDAEAAEKKVERNRCGSLVMKEPEIAPPRRRVR